MSTNRIIRTMANACLIVSLIAGCAKEELEPADYSEKVLLDAKPVSRDSTYQWHDLERGGAAYRGKEYQQVLATRVTEKVVDDRPVSQSPTIITKPFEHATSTAIKSFSVYEMSRWERFCGKGKMDVKDWDFVAQQGRENVPADLAHNCAPPPYSRKEYIAAWKVSCTNGAVPSKQQNIIRRETIGPKDVCTMKE